MSKYTTLFNKIQESVYPAYGTKYTYGVLQENHKTHLAKAHSYLILLLEIIIHEHRAKYATAFASIKGVEALKHKLLIDKVASIHELSDISLECIVFAPLKDLRLENLTLSAQTGLEKIELIETGDDIDLSLALSWNLGDGQMILSQY